jgi:hypothetical protein
MRITNHFAFGETRMRNAQDVKSMTIKVPVDLHAKLLEWAAANISSINAELIRSFRERAERERAKAEAV